jgi:predicted phosphodiesterase
MFDIKWWHRRKEPSFLYHSVYVSNLHEKSEINFLHVTDTHVARRNDLIPEVLSETRDSHEARRLRLRYNNFNDNLRAVIRFANKEKVDFMAVTGDLVDYYHDGILVYEDGIGWFHDYQAGKRGERGGWQGNPAQADSNVREFVEIVTGQDGRGEALKCPIFCIPGNHDYLRMEPPLALKAKFYILFFPVRDVPRGPESWGLDLQEGAEFEFWKKTKGDSLVKRLKRLRDGEGFDPVEFSTEQAVLFTTPEFDDTAQYITEISYDTDFCVKVGSHRLVCLNTGEDVFIPDVDGWTKAELVVDRGDTSHLSTLSKGEKHFLDGQSHNRGILPSHLEMITEAVSEAKSIEGLTFVFTHAPLVRERKPGDFDTSRLQWNMAGTLSEDEYCHFDSRVQDRNSIPGLDGSIAEWDSHILVSMVRWIQLGAGGVDAVFSGHSHDIKEYRLNKEAQVCSGKYSQGVSTTPTDEKEKWLREHSPLQLISGKLKGQKREFRHVVIKNSHIRSMGMREIPRFYQQDTSRIGLFFTAKSIELARFGCYTSSARNDLNPATHLNWAQGKRNRLAVMWDLMEKYWLQLGNVEYLEAVLQSEGRSSMPQHLREKLERVEAAIEDAIPKYARIVGRYPETDWWYDPQDLGLPYGRRRNQFYAICAASLNEFGVDFGSSEKNSLDLKIHYEWSRKKGRTRLQDALEERIGKLFEFAHAGPSHLLAMWYASESVHLAPWSAWNENPGRGRRDPGLHLRWALTQSGKAILDDLCEKYEVAAKSQYRHLEERGLKEFYIYHSVRMAAWGASVGQPREDQADPTYFEAEAERLKSIASDAQTWVDLIIGDLRNRAKMITYSLLEPGYQPQNRITLNDGNSYDFSEGTSGMHTGGDFYLSGLKFLANNVGQRGTKDLGDIGTIPLDQVDIPKSGYTRRGVSAAVGHTYVSLAQEGEEGGYIVFRLHIIRG